MKRNLPEGSIKEFFSWNLSFLGKYFNYPGACNCVVNQHLVNSEVSAFWSAFPVGKLYPGVI